MDLLLERKQGDAAISPESFSAPAGFDALLASLRRRSASLFARLLEQVAARRRDVGLEDDAAWERVVRALRRCLHAQLAALGGTDRGAADGPQGLVLADGAPELELLNAGVHSAQNLVWEEWSSLVEECAHLGAGPRREYLARGSRSLFACAERQSEAIMSAYRHRLERDECNPGQLRLGEVRRLLAGETEPAARLGLQLDHSHLGLVGWGAQGKESLRELAARLGRPALIVRAAEQSWWGWLSAARPLSDAEEAGLGAFNHPRAQIAAGLEARGAAGFRLTHHQAQRARACAPQSEGPALLRYSDVAIEALATENAEDARAFVVHELRGIGDESAASQRIRETLRAYFDSEYNAASAAATLGIHQQTVANRLRAAEQRLGRRSIGVRRVELEMALRLRDLLGTDAA